MYASVGWDCPWGCGLALAPWFGAFTRHYSVSGLLVPTAHYSRARSGCGSSVTYARCRLTEAEGTARGTSSDPVQSRARYISSLRPRAYQPATHPPHCRAKPHGAVDMELDLKFDLIPVT